MKKLIGLGLLGLLIVFSSVAHSDSAERQTKPEPSNKKVESVKVKATIYGNFDYAFEGTGAWVGYALISFADAPAKLATFVDRNTSFNQRKNGDIYGTETISLRFADGSGTLDIDASFEGIQQSTPSLYLLRETGTICRGTDKYVHASGSVTVRGPFLFPNPTVIDSPPWIAEMHGVIFGLDVP